MKQLRQPSREEWGLHLQSLGLFMRRASLESRQDAKLHREQERETARRLLGELLGSPTPVDYGYNAVGAPFLPALPQYRLSISHSEHECLVVLSRNGIAVGVDVEELGERVARVQSRFVTTPEAEALAQLNAETRHIALHLLWSAKEAAYKLINPSSGSLLSFVAQIGPLQYPYGAFDMLYQESQFLHIMYHVDECSVCCISLISQTYGAK